MMIIDLITYELNIFIAFSERLSMYFGIIVYLFFIPQLSKFVKGNKKIKYIITNILLIFIMLGYYLLKFVYQNAGNTFPYQSSILNI